MTTEPKQTEPKQCKSEVEEVCILFPKTWKLTLWQQLYLKINSGFHARENPSEAKITESSQTGELHEIINF